MTVKELVFREKMAKLNFFDITIHKQSIGVSYITFGVDKKPIDTLRFEFELHNGKVCLYDDRFYRNAGAVPDFCVQRAFKHILDYLKEE